jgi:toxin ParE1/3/4
MSLRILRSAGAEEDLIEIWRSIAMHSPLAADRMLERLEHRWRQLSDYPYSGMARGDIAVGIRHLLVGQYLTLYRVTDDGVFILRVLHGRRDIDADDVAE